MLAMVCGVFREHTYTYIFVYISVYAAVVCTLLLLADRKHVMVAGGDNRIIYDALACPLVRARPVPCPYLTLDNPLKNWH
jgi:hypothetical membrane protein